MKKLLTLIAFASYIFGANMAFAIPTGTLVSDSMDANIYADGVYFDSDFDPADEDETDYAADSTTDDVRITTSEMFDEDLYIGSNTVFDKVIYQVDVAGSSSRICTTIVCHHYNLEYYNGESSTWETLSYTDGGNNFESTGEEVMEFDVPSAWDDDGTKTTINGQTLFWIRLSRNTNTTVSTDPQVSELALSAYNVELTVENELGAAITTVVSEDFDVNDGTSNRVEAFRDMGDGVYQMGLNGGLTDSNYNLVWNEDGYVEKSVSTGVLASIKMSLSGEMKFAHKIRVTNQDGTAITPDTAYADVVGSGEHMECEISGANVYCPLSLDEDGTSSSFASIMLTKSGYDDLTEELSAERDDNADSQVVTAVEMTETETPTTTGFYTLSVENEDGDDLISLVEADFTVSGGTVNNVVDFTNNGDGTYTFELATGSADADYSIEVDASGYDVESVSTGTLTTGATTTGTIVLDYSTSSSSTGYLEVTVMDEDGDELSTLSRSNFTIAGGSDDRIYGFTNNNDGTYVVELATGNSDNNYNVTVTKDGYVSDDFDTDEIGTGTTSRSISLDFAYKVTVTNEAGDFLSGANVKAGDLSTTCQYLGSGEYGCAVSLSKTSYSYRVSLSGYITENGTFYSDRTSHSDAQKTANVELEINEEACEVPFDDIYGHWAEGYVEELFCREVVNGKDEDTYAPNDNVTRAEFLKIALLNAGYEVDGEAGEEFSDVSTGDWFYEYVSYGADQGFIEGYSDSTFRPNDSINRAEALVIIMRIAGEDEYEVDEDWEEFEDVDADDWFAYAIELSADAGIVEGYDNGEFRPANSITRAEVAAVAVRTYNEYYAD